MKNLRYSILQESFENNTLILILMQASTSETHISYEHLFKSIFQHP